MKIYHYSHISGKYLGEGEADPCPVTGTPLVPAWATTEAPPAVGANQYAAFENGQWVTKDALQTELDQEPTAEEIEAAAWAELRAERDRRLKDPAIMDRIDRYRNQHDGGLPTTDTAEWFQAVLEFLQALRDLPANTTDPANPVWPVPPI